MAQKFKQWIVESDNFELAVDTELNLVCFAHKNGDELSERILEQVNSTGKVYLTHTKLKEKFVHKPKTGTYDTVVLAVKHENFIKLGAHKLREYGNINHVFFDLKYTFDASKSSERI